MYVYLDKFDYLVNNLHNEEFDEEISSLQEKIEKIEENNHFFFKRLQNIIKTEEIESSNKIDLTSRQIFQNRFDNLSNQIFSLQMKQFAESIWNIKKDIKRNKYILIFDHSEGMQSLLLDEAEYKDLIRYRDPMNSISVYDLFQEKIHSYYTSNLKEGPTTQSDGKIKKKRGRKPKNKNLQNTADVSSPKKRGRKRKYPLQEPNITNNFNNISPTSKKEKIQIARVVNINYDFCHHCKQRKPTEVMKRCSSGINNKTVERPLKTFYINNTTCVKSKIK